MVYLELLDYVDYTLVSSSNSKTSAARLPGSIPGIPTKPNKLSKNKVFYFRSKFSEGYKR